MAPGTYEGKPSQPINRRSVLKLMGSAAALGVAGPGILAACSSSGGGTAKSSAAAGTGGATTASAAGASAGTAAGGSISFGSNYSDPAAKAAFTALTQAATAKTGVAIDTNTVDHNTFQNNINSYLQGTPNDLFTWFAGYRVQIFAKNGLIAPIDDVWEKIGDNFGNAAKALSKGQDGKYYIVPIYNYPWVVFYNKSTWQQKGYQIPKTWDDLMTLSKKMQGDGLIPFAFGQKDGWPALGTFDILDLRINGYDYHMKLCRHEVPWTDPGVTAVFDKWRELMPYIQQGATGRNWEDAVKTLESKKAGMMFQGTNQVAAQYVTDKANLDDLDFFVYPEIDPKWGQDFMDAPADGFCLSAKAKPADVAAAKKVLEYLGTGEAEITYLKTDQWDVAIGKDVKVPTYNAIQKKSAEVIAACTEVAQFLDRDSDGGFADNTVAAAIDKFMNDPTAATVTSIQASLEAQAKVVFASS